MSLVVGLIHRQTQAAQQLGVDQGLVRAPNGIALNGSKLSGFWVLPPAHFQTAAAQKLLKGLQLVGRRRLVHTKQHRSEEHTSELQSRGQLVCRLLLEKKNN